MELYFLGTGAGAPSRARGVSALAVRFDQGRDAWLFDCGEGTQQRILEAPFSAGQIVRIFLTHLHGDHLFGLPGLLGSRSLQDHAGQPVQIFGPAGVADYLAQCLRVSGTRLSFGWTVNEWTPSLRDRSSGMARSQGHQAGREPWTALAEEAWTVRALSLRHGIPCLGYALEERPRPGRFRIELARELGIPEGPVYGRLKRGEDVRLEDGRLVRGVDLTEPERPGRKIVILGDTAPCPNAVRLAKGADVLVHEATFSERDADLARSRRHSTAVDAARTARDAGAKALVLTHVSPRYQNDADLAALLAEARAVFPSTVLARDHFAYTVEG